MFQNYLGRRIYIIFFLSLLAALSEGFGIVMLFPLFETLDGLAIAPSEGINKYLFDFLNYFGLADSVSKIILVITIAFLMKGLVTFFSMGFNAFLIGQLLKELKGSLFDRYTLMSYGYYTSKDTGHFTNLINEQPTKAIEAFKQLTLCVGQIVNTIVTAEPMPSFTLLDFNPNSDYNGEYIGPETFRGEVSCYYFGKQG